ncbi:MAG: 6-bladed beta-propeller [Paramuribaculum sp.]|nr:6-bladed beta-propeller [Paramuribaculum sp.]
MRSTLVLFAALLLFGCSKPTPSSGDGITTYHLDFDELRDTICPLSMIADSVSYIDLETTPQSLLAQVTACGFCDSGIVVFDQRGGSVLLFSGNGKFLRPIGAKGQGPGEYIRPEAIDVDRNIVYVYDGLQGSILKYALDGSFIGTDSVGRVDDFVHCPSEGPDSYLVALFQWKDDYGFYHVTTDPVSSRKVVGAIDVIPVKSLLNFFRYGDDKIAMMPNSFDNRVYQWKADSVSLGYVLDITPMPSSEQIENLVGRQRVEHYNRMAFCDSSRWLIVNYWRYPEDFRTVVIDKKQDSVRLFEHMENDLDTCRRGYGIKGGYNNGSLFYALDDPDTDDNPRLQLFHLKN